MSANVLAVRQVAAAAEEDGGSNFLLPNGTFFVVLVIFLLVLGVIGTFVVPPIMKVLRERDNMVTKTLTDNKQSAEQFAAAEADYETAMATARVQASTVRDDARAEGRKVVDEKRAGADAEVASTLERASEQFKQEGDATAADLQARVETLSTALASRILGVSVGPASSVAASATSGTRGR